MANFVHFIRMLMFCLEVWGGLGPLGPLLGYAALAGYRISPRTRASKKVASESRYLLAVTINPAAVTIACKLLLRQSGRGFLLIGWASH